VVRAATHVVELRYTHVGAAWLAHGGMAFPSASDRFEHLCIRSLVRPDCFTFQGPNFTCTFTTGITMGIGMAERAGPVSLAVT
jgi:hypothetical protein